VKYARLTYERLRVQDGCSLVAVRLETGRTHQIRVQFSSRGFPLLGDRKYGARDTVSEIRLFSHRLTFPLDGHTHCFEATPPWDI